MTLILINLFATVAIWFGAFFYRDRPVLGFVLIWLGLSFASHSDKEMVRQEAIKANVAHYVDEEFQWKEVK